MVKKRQFWVVIRVVKTRELLASFKRGSFGWLLVWLKRGSFCTY